MIRVVETLPDQHAQILYTHTHIHSAIHTPRNCSLAKWPRGEKIAVSFLTWCQSSQRVMRPNGNAFKAAQIVISDGGGR